MSKPECSKMKRVPSPSGASRKLPCVSASPSADHENASRLGGSHSSTWQRTTIPSKPALGFGGTRNVWRWGEDRSSGRSAKEPSRATRPPASLTSPSAPRRVRRLRGCRCSACPCPCWRLLDRKRGCRGRQPRQCHGSDLLVPSVLE